MAIFIEGKTECCFCKKTINHADEAIMFPPFITNKHDPMIVFNDAVVHTECLSKHPRAHEINKLLDAYGKRDRLTCTICHQQIKTPDEYIGTGCLSSCVEGLSKYNFTQYHKQCFEDSEIQHSIRYEINVLREKGEWDSLVKF